ncbi:MAG TPA: hypothetical protein VHQ01_09710, partial [Pyrinomonadaceae bacterium]|nr:hypothetical protein [Pyrinomonadaceae bacterium]
DKDPQNPTYAIGIAFIGQNPPENYYENPSQLYDITHREEEGGGFWKLIAADLMSDDSHLPKDDRKQTRFSIPETLIIQRVDDAGNTLEEETTVSENISFSGAAVMTSLSLGIGTFLRVTSERSDVTILSVVRGTRMGEDGISRLHIEFIDRFFPLEGIE